MKPKTLKKTRIFMVLLLILTMVAFAGCGNDDTPKDGVDGNNTTVTDGNDNDKDGALDDNALDDTLDNNGVDGNNATNGAMTNGNDTNGTVE